MDTKKMMRYPKFVFLLTVALILLFFLVIGLSFAVLLYSKRGAIVNTIQTGTLTMTYNEGSTGISIQNALPMTDEAGKKLSGSQETFKFTVSSSISGNANIDYEIAAIKKSGSTLDDQYVKLYLERSQDGTNYMESMAPKTFSPISTQTSLGTPLGAMILEKGTFMESQMNYYLLRMWIDENADLPNEPNYYTVTVNVYGTVKKYLSK